MAIVVALVVIVALLLLGAGVAFFVFMGKRQATKNSAAGVVTPGVIPDSASGGPSGLRWQYVLLPLVLLVFTIVAAAYFYPLLPARVGYHFGNDGSPDAWVGKAVLVGLTIVLQLILSMAAAAIGLIVSRLGEIMKAGEVSVRSLGGVIAVMTNMVALPQLLVFFVVLDIFSYNAYGSHYLSSSLLAVLVIGLGSFVLVLFFYRAMRQARTTK